MARLVANAQIHGYSLKTINDDCWVVKKWLITSCFFYFFSFQHGIAQKERIAPTLRKLYESADKTLPFDREEALKLYHKIIETDSTFAAPYMRIGQILFSFEDTKQQSYFYFEKAVKADSTEKAFLKIYEILGTYYLQKGNYSKAEYYLKGFLRISTYTKSLSHRSVQRYLAQCYYARNKVPAVAEENKHERLPYPINQASVQSYPVLTADLQTLIYTKNTGDEDIFVSERISNGWSVPKSLSSVINSNTNEGTCSISADGRILVFTACHRQTNIGKCDLYISSKNGTIWSEPRNLGPTVNLPGWQSQPSLSADGTQLYFSSDRQGGLGGKDIWFTSLDTSGVWNVPINLGPEINTEFDEVSPFIHSNGQTLFFASDGWPSVGGLDIFVSKRETGSWTTPQNLGYPLNDFADQMGFYITPNCEEAFYSYHNRSRESNSGTAVSLLCRYSLSDSLTHLCSAMTFVKGRINDAETKKPLKATVNVGKYEKSSTFQSDDSSGKFLFVVPAQDTFRVQIQRKGYFTRYFNLKFGVDSSFQNGTWEISLTPIKVDSSIVINSTLFSKNSAQLLLKSPSMLDHLVEYLQQNPAKQLLIEGHTDDVGTIALNYKLSVQRAEAVKQYLLAKGVEERRLIVKGYGKSKPLVTNGSEELKQQNRRVECKIVQID